MFVMAIIRHSQQNYSVFVPVVKEEMSFKAISIVVLVAILFDGLFGKFDSHELNSWSSGSDVVLKIFEKILFSTLAAILFDGAEQCVHFW